MLNLQIPHSNATTSTKKPKKLIHFSDGSTMEVEDEIDTASDNTKFVEEQVEDQKHNGQDPVSLPSLIKCIYIYPRSPSTFIISEEFVVARMVKILFP